MNAAQLRNLPVNLRNRFGKEVLDEIEATFNRRRDEIDAVIDAADAHMSVDDVRAMARLN